MNPISTAGCGPTNKTKINAKNPRRLLADANVGALGRVHARETDAVYGGWVFGFPAEWVGRERRGREGASPAMMDPFGGWALGPGLVMLRAHCWVCTQDSSWQGSEVPMGGTPGLDGFGPLSSGKGLGPKRQGPGLVFLIGRNQRERRSAHPPPIDRTRAPSRPAWPFWSGLLQVGSALFLIGKSGSRRPPEGLA